MIKFAGLGHAGLALSTSSVALFGFFALLIILSRRINGIHGAQLWDSFWKISVASAVMAAVCWCSSHGLHRVFGNKVRVDLVDVLISIPLGLLVFYNAAQWLCIAEL
jgi:putative peptidoglycan lipid II flippase